MIWRDIHMSWPKSAILTQSVAILSHGVTCRCSANQFCCKMGWAAETWRRRPWWHWIQGSDLLIKLTFHGFAWNLTDIYWYIYWYLTTLGIFTGFAPTLDENQHPLGQPWAFLILFFGVPRNEQIQNGYGTTATAEIARNSGNITAKNWAQIRRASTSSTAWWFQNWVDDIPVEEIFAGSTPLAADAPRETWLWPRKTYLLIYIYIYIFHDNITYIDIRNMAWKQQFLDINTEWWRFSISNILGAPKNSPIDRNPHDPRVSSPPTWWLCAGGETFQTWVNNESQKGCYSWISCGYFMILLDLAFCNFLLCVPMNHQGFWSS